MKSIKEIKSIILKNIKTLSSKYGVKDIGVFGSYIDNNQKAESDIDILVEFNEMPDLIKFIELESYLENLLQTKVDLVEKSSIRPQLKKEILQSVVMV